MIYFDLILKKIQFFPAADVFGIFRWYCDIIRVESIMKRYLCLQFLIILGFSANAQKAVIPSQAQYWLKEIQTVNAGINEESFNLIHTDKTEYSGNTGLSISDTDPVFRRWNSTADKAACYYHGIIWTREGSELYAGPGAVDAPLEVYNNKGELIHYTVFGPGTVINTFCWLNKNTLLLFGSTLNFITDLWDLVIYEYVYEDDYIIRNLYFAENAFTTEENKALKLNWYEYRDDIFKF